MHLSMSMKRNASRLVRHGRGQIEKEGEWLKQQKEELITTLSHELRTPLTIVREALSHLKDGIAGPLTESQARVVRMADRNIDRLIQVISQRLEDSIQKILRGRRDD